MRVARTLAIAKPCCSMRRSSSWGSCRSALPAISWRASWVGGVPRSSGWPAPAPCSTRGGPALRALLAGSVAANYAIGQRILRLAGGGQVRPARALADVGVAANLGLLGWFKYADLLLGSLAPGATPLGIVLPLASAFSLSNRSCSWWTAPRRARRCRAAALCVLRHLLPAPDRGADRAPAGDPAAIHGPRIAIPMRTT